jgi:hypothetical protein
MGIDVVDGDVGLPSAGVAAMKIFGPVRFDQHHPVAVHKHRVVDVTCSTRVFAEDPGFEAERILKPVRRGLDFAMGSGPDRHPRVLVIPRDLCLLLSRRRQGSRLNSFGSAPSELAVSGDLVRIVW